MIFVTIKLSASAKISKNVKSLHNPSPSLNKAPDTEFSVPRNIGVNTNGWTPVVVRLAPIGHPFRHSLLVHVQVVGHSCNISFCIQIINAILMGYFGEHVNP